MLGFLINQGGLFSKKVKAVELIMMAPHTKRVPRNPYASCISTSICAKSNEEKEKPVNLIPFETPLYLSKNITTMIPKLIVDAPTPIPKKK